MDWLRKIADKHNLMNNKLTSVVRRMTANERTRNNTEQHEENIRLNKTTMQAYLKEAATITKAENLTLRQKDQIKENWRRKSTRATKQQTEEQKQADEEQLSKQIEQLEQGAKETKEIAERMNESKVENAIHVAAIKRAANVHAEMAKRYRSKTQEEIQKARKERNSCKVNMVKNMAKETMDRRAQPLTCVERDSDANEGGRLVRSPRTRRK